MVVTDQGWLIRTALTTLTGPRSTGPAVGGKGGGAVQDLSRARPSCQTDAPLGGGGRHSARTGAGVAGGSFLSRQAIILDNLSRPTAEYLSKYSIVHHLR